MPKRKIINIGCGEKKIKDAINVDILGLPGVDKSFDITKEWPKELAGADEVIADYVLCQIGGRNEFRFVMNQIWEILKPGGVFKLKVPDAGYQGKTCHYNDPMDCRYFTTETFDYFNKDHYRFKAFKYGFYPWEIKKIENIGNLANPEIKNRLYVEMKKPND